MLYDLLPKKSTTNGSSGVWALSLQQTWTVARRRWGKCRRWRL